MPSPLLTLQNPHLTAHFTTDSGALVHLASRGSKKSTLTRAAVRYSHESTIFGEGLWPDETQRFEVTSLDVQPAAGIIETHLRSPHLQITRRFILTPTSPLLRITCEIRHRPDLAAPVILNVPGFPFIDFTPDYNDAFEDEKDLFFAGLELAGGRQTPAWQVFFRKGHREGLLVVGRTKHRMQQMYVRSRSIQGTPHMPSNYTSDPLLPMTLAPTTRLDTDIEIAPWQKSKHAALVKAAQLNVPVLVPTKTSGKRPPRKPGVTIPALKLAASAALTTKFHTAKWQLVSLPWTRSPKVLFAGTGVAPPTLKFTPKQRGLFRVFAGIANGEGIVCRHASQPYPTLRWHFTLESETGDSRNVSFNSYLTGSHKSHEVDLGVFELDGKPLFFNRLPNRQQPCFLDYVRLQKLSAADAARWRQQENAEPSIPLSGLNDTPDIASLDDGAHPDLDLYRANIWEHARCKIKRIYWRIDGQCSDFPSKHNTMRYISAKVHGVYGPNAKGYGRALKQVNMLKLAVAESHKYGLEIYGWMRFNNYTGNVQSDFFKQNPQFHEIRENGRKIAKLCLAIPQVREHKLSILLEAASYGLDGLNLGFLRHPPVFMFHPTLIEGYTKKFGAAPPIIPNRPDERFIDSLPPTDAAHTRWYQYRADFLTDFGRELKKRLHAMGKGHLKIALWVRPNHCLFDGIDLPTWLNEGLCHEVVVNGMIGPDRAYSLGNKKEYDPVVCGVPKPWRNMVQAKAALIRCLTHVPLAWWKPHLAEVFAEGYDGLCTYESDWSVLNPEFIDFYRCLRK